MKAKRLRRGVGPFAPAYIGLDLSLIGTGMAVVVGGYNLFYHGWTDIKAKQKAYPEILSYFSIQKGADIGHRIHRISWIVEWVDSWLQYFTNDREIVVAIEGYSFSSRGSRNSDQYELGGAIKSLLWDKGIPFRIYEPSTVKKAWTGNGAAKKAEMLMACFKLFNLDFTRLGDAADNLADAVLIAQLLFWEAQAKGGMLTQVPKSVLEVLKRTTKKTKVCLLDQDFIQRCELPGPILGGPQIG